jgi:putative zinc finger protein
MGITCETVWRESSNYLEGDIAAELRIAMDEHIQGCRECASVMDGLRNVVTLYGDERMFELPDGFSRRLQRKLEASKPPTRRQFFGWAVAFAASVVAVGSFELLHHATQEKAVAPPHKPKPVPPDMQVVVADGGKHFHRAACPLLLGRSNRRTIAAGEGIHEGFGPCPRCMSEYL